MIDNPATGGSSLVIRIVSPNRRDRAWCVRSEKRIAEGFGTRIQHQRRSMSAFVKLEMVNLAVCRPPRKRCISIDGRGRSRAGREELISYMLHPLSTLRKLGYVDTGMSDHWPRRSRHSRPLPHGPNLLFTDLVGITKSLPGDRH